MFIERFRRPYRLVEDDRDTPACARTKAAPTMSACGSGCSIDRLSWPAKRFRTETVHCALRQP